jgi:MFS transporter, DHA2 family, multidrug resistance protein
MSALAIDLADDTSAGAGLRRALVLGTCTAVTLLYGMTITVANVSLPQMQGALSATQDQIAWVLTANIAATAVATPLTGWLVSRFGRRRLCSVCVFAFGVTSLACGFAESLDQLVLFRALQGAFGAPLTPASQAIVLETYPRRSHGAVMAIYGMGSVLGPIVGPVVGGHLSEAYDWRYVFYMIVPFSAFALVGTWFFIRDRESPMRVRLDWLGFLLLAAALASLQVMLDRGERADWFDSGEIIAYCVVALAAFYAFVVHSATAERPFLQPTLLRDRNFTIGLVLIFVFGMLNFTPMSLIPPLLQGVSGYPESVIGFVLGARGLGTMAAFSLMIFASRFDPRAMIVFGFLLQGFAGWQLTGLDMNPSAEGVFWPMALQGFGVGVLWVPITMVTFSTIQATATAEAAAIYNMVRNVGSSIHISLSTALAVHMARMSYAELAPAVSPYNEALGMPWVTGGWNVHDPAGLAAVAREIARQAAMLGYIDAFVFYVATALVVLPLVLLVRWTR